MTDVRQKKIGFVGLGRMGAGIAGVLVKKGFDVLAYDREVSARTAMATRCSIGECLENVMSSCDVLLLSLPGSPEVEEVSEAFLRSGPQGKVLIDLSSSIPASTQKLAERLQQVGCKMLDAPLGGGPAQAAEGQLTAMVGGNLKCFQTCRPIFEAIASNIFYVGPSGSGHAIKLGSNYLSVMYVALYAEILPLLQKIGVNLDSFFEVVCASGGNSPMFKLIAPRIMCDQYSRSFAMKLGIKDLSYVKAIFKQLRAKSPLLDAGLGVYNEAKEQGLADEDISAVAQVSKRRLGLKSPKR